MFKEKARRFRLAIGAVLLAAAALLAFICLPVKDAPGDQGSVRLSFWTVNSRYADYMYACAQRYNAQSQGRQIELDVKVYSRRFIVDQISKSLLNEAQVPDLVDIQFNDMNKFVSSAEHTLLLYPLDSLVAAASDPRAEALEPFSFNDTLLAVPYSTGAMALFYNRALLERYQIDPVGIRSWDQFFALDSAITDPDGPALLALDVNNNDLIFAMLLAADPELSNADAAEIAASERFAGLVERLKSALKSGALMIPEEFDIYNQQFYETFQAGKCLCVIAPLEYANEFLHNMPKLRGKLLVTPLPAAAKDNGDIWVAQYGTAITSKGKNISLAKDFLRFAKLSEQAYRETTEALLVRSIAADPQMSSALPENAAYRAYFEIPPLEAVPDCARAAGFVGASGLPEAAAKIVPELLSALDG